MKTPIFSLLLLLLFGCSTNYYEYEIINKTSGPIRVKMEIEGEGYIPFLEEVIEPNQNKRIFEHEAYGENKDQNPLQPIKGKSKFIKSIVIINSKNQESKKDFFCEGCSDFSIYEGSTGIQGIYQLTIEDRDFYFEK